MRKQVSTVVLLLPKKKKQGCNSLGIGEMVMGEKCSFLSLLETSYVVPGSLCHLKKTFSFRWGHSASLTWLPSFHQVPWSTWVGCYAAVPSLIEPYVNSYSRSLPLLPFLTGLLSCLLSHFLGVQLHSKICFSVNEIEDLKSSLTS